MKWFFLLFVPSICLGAGLVNGTLSPIGGSSSGGGATNAIGTITGPGLTVTYSQNGNGSSNANIVIPSFGFPSLVSTNTIFVDPIKGSSGGNGSITNPFALPSQAIAVSSIGNTIFCWPGDYVIGGNRMAMVAGTTLYFSPGARVLADTSGTTAHAILFPANNCTIWNPTILVTNSDATVDIPIGAGTADATVFTNVTIYNAYITNCSDGFYIDSTVSPSEAYSWTLINPTVISSWDCYVEQVSVGNAGTNTTLIVNPRFIATNINTVALGQVRTCIKQVVRSWGTITVQGGLFKVFDYTNSPATVIVDKASGLATNASIIEIGTVHDDSMMTNTASLDISCTNNTVISSAVRTDNQVLLTSGSTWVGPTVSGNTVFGGTASIGSNNIAFSGDMLDIDGTGVYRGPTNAAPLGFETNLTLASILAGSFMTNLTGGRVEARGAIVCTAVGQVATIGKATFDVDTTINGSLYQDAAIGPQISGVANITNTVTSEVRFTLGPKDYFQIATNLAGAGSLITVNQFRFIVCN